DSDPAALGRSQMTLAPADRVPFSASADPLAAAEEMIGGAQPADGAAWAREVQAAIAYRPPEWRALAAAPGAPLHAVEVGRAAQQLLDGAREAVLVADGGEFGQWAQACVSA